MKADPSVNVYIQNSEPFAVPVLTYLRELVHSVCPESEETIKWNFPHFLYRGRNLCSMAAFRHHCAFTLSRGNELKDEHGILTRVGRTSMGHLGRITGISDLPPAHLLQACIREAMALEDAGKVKKPTRPVKAIQMPAELTDALAGNELARACFGTLPPSHQRAYAEWVAEAKKNETRINRAARAVIKILEEGNKKGKKRG